MSPTTVVSSASDSSDDSLSPLRQHPAFQIADMIAEFVGVERDLVQFTEFLSLAAGVMVTPINLDVQSDNLTVDLHLANRILDLHIGHIARVDTHREFRALERARFHLQTNRTDGDSENASSPQPLSVVLVRGNHRLLHRDVTEYTARVIGADSALPSLWRVGDVSSPLPPVPSTLRIQTTLTGRGLDDFGVAFSAHRESAIKRVLEDLLQRLPTQPLCNCAFRQEYRGAISPEFMLVTERLLSVMATLRILLANPESEVFEINYDDFRATRALLTTLPLTPIDRQVSPQALVTAENVHGRLQDAHEQLSLPDLSDQGHKWFTRRDAMRWTGLGYNTVKKHLGGLEGEGLMQTTVAENNRERGSFCVHCLAFYAHVGTSVAPHRKNSRGCSRVNGAMAPFTRLHPLN